MSDSKEGGAADAGMYRGRWKEASGWMVFGGALLLILGAIAFTFLTPLVFGLFLYYGTRPIFRRLRGRGFPAEVAALTALLAVGLPVVVVMVLVTLTAFSQGMILLEQGQLAQMEPFVDSTILQQLQAADTTSAQDFLASEGFRKILTSSWGAVSSFTNTLLGALLTIVLSFVFAFFMFGWGPRARRDAIAVLDDGSSVLERFLESLDRDLSSLFFGNMLNAIITSIIGAAAYTLLNSFAPAGVSVPAPILIGLLTGIASFVPVFGSKIVYVPAGAIIAFTAHLTQTPAGYGFAVVFLLVALFIVDTLPDLVLRPLISGRGQSTGPLFISYLIGPLFFGFIGIFLMPVLTLTFINFRRQVLPGFMRDE